MRAMIFAAGLGTRLRPITDTIPKALVPVAGVPMLERVINKVRDAGIGEIVVNAHHFSDKVEEFLKSRDFGVKINLSIERGEPLETGGGIKKAREYLEGDSFLVHNADILSDADLGWLISKSSPVYLATLLVSKRETTRYLLFDDDMHLVGWTNAVTGEVKSPYPNLDPAICRKYSFAGIHVISDKVFPLMESFPDKFSIVDFYLKYAGEYPILGVEPEHLDLIDVGSPERLAEAEKIYSRI
ncbi:MAG: nucleotidyltransferase family protein [Bacteroidales bacterium]|nr:nucleotidyltransferase family protein [Bacteroidales bacterium]